MCIKLYQATMRVLLAVILMASFIPIVQAQLVNGGFESGDLTGWSVVIPAGGYINVVGAGSGETAIEGNFFANMKTDGPGSFTTLSQAFNADPGQEISGYAFFLDQEFLQNQPCTFQDSMSVDIVAGATVVANVFYTQHCTDGVNFDDGSLPWTLWSYTFDGTEPPGPYAVQARITNIGDSNVDSTSGVDGVELTGVFKSLVSGPDVDGDGEIDLTVQIGQDPSTAMYDFVINYHNPGGPEVLIKDTVPAEWNVGQVELIDGSNTGFEDGDFSGWNVFVPVGGSATVETGHAAAGATSNPDTCEFLSGYDYIPVEGNSFAVLKTDGPGSFTMIDRELYLNEGMTISGYAAFDFGDYPPFNDNASVQIFDSDDVLIATPWYAEGDDGLAGYDGPWTFWSFTAPENGFYTVVYRNNNTLDGACDSFALFDGELVTYLNLECEVEGANKKDNGKSATKINCVTDADWTSAVFWADARCHDNKKNTKCKPTSCGALYLNDGAEVYELIDGEPAPDPLFVSNSLCLAAVDDLNGDGLVPDGTGDEDGDGLTDYEEACEGPTYVCDPDSDDDGVLDGADACPLEGPADPDLGEILDPNGCLRQSQCSDGIDNDGNTFIDFPDDLGCHDILDDLEESALCVADWTCGQELPICGTGGVGDICICDLDVDGNSFCWGNFVCGDPGTNVCDSNADCADGFACVTSCCGTTCAPVCPNTNLVNNFSAEPMSGPDAAGTY